MPRFAVSCSFTGTSTIHITAASANDAEAIISTKIEDGEIDPPAPGDCIFRIDDIAETAQVNWLVTTPTSKRIIMAPGNMCPKEVHAAIKKSSQSEFTIEKIDTAPTPVFC